MPEHGLPTQQHNDPAQRPEGDAPRDPGAAYTSGHWYSYPGQQAPSQTPSTPPVENGWRAQGHTARDRVKRRKVRRQLGAPDDWAWVVIAAALLGVTAVMSIAIFLVLDTARPGRNSAVSTSVPVEPTSVLYGPGGILEASSAGEAGGLLGDGQSMVIRPWDGQERFNVLVMGMDRRPGEAGGGYRTDTMILISLDPISKRVGMLNIPRDLYVDIPGYGLDRINAAYANGEIEEPGGGPRLAMQTVQYNFGIPINDYAIVDFTTFIRIIDLIGGIDVEVREPINDPTYPDMNYGYDPFYLPAGWQHLDGGTALKYARSRHNSDDIDRQRRQQEVIYAIRDRVLAYDMIASLAPQAFTLWAELKDGIRTGLSLDQMLQLAWYVKDIPAENFSRGVVGWEHVIPTNWQGMDILVPNREKLGQLMVTVFGPDYNR